MKSTSQSKHEVPSQVSTPTQSSQNASKGSNRRVNGLRLSAIIFLLIFVALFAVGVQKYYEKATVYKHFNAYSVVQTGNEVQLLGILSGQMKSEDAGFFVGDVISIDLLLKVEQQEYQQVKGLDPAIRVMFVTNAEDPSTASKDISQPIKEGNLTAAFIQPGMLKVTRFLPDNQTMLLEGNVTFTIEGPIQLTDTKGTQPLQPIIDKYNLSSVEGTSIGPSYAKYEVHFEKSTVALAWLAVAFSALAISMTLWVTSLSIATRK